MSNLPAGVNERDLEMFTQSQEAAKEFLHRENMGIASLPHAISGPNDAAASVGVSTTVSKGGPDHGVPSQIAVPHLSASTPGKFLINWAGIRQALLSECYMMITSTVGIQNPDMSGFKMVDFVQFLNGSFTHFYFCIKWSRLNYLRIGHLNTGIFTI